MTYRLSGLLTAALCDNCFEPLAGIELRAYAPVAERVGSAAELAPKRAEAAPSARLLGRTTVDSSGAYVFDVDGDGYEGGALDIQLVVSRPPRPVHEPDAPPRSVDVGRIQPEWDQGENGSSARWDYCLPNDFWCEFLALFGIWTICGHLLTCADSAPIPGATVNAFDADWLQDDALGAAVTDASGHFLITYLASAFRRTPFSPLLNVELTEGPDLYFTAMLGGTPILTETQSDGRRRGRENVGPCFCVDLCSDQVIVTPDNWPHWQQVRTFDIHPPAGALGSAFSAEGYADPAGGAYVFGDDVPLRGNCPLYEFGTSDALEYRFLIGEYGWSTTPDDPTQIPSVAPASMDPVMALLSTQVGYVSYTDGFGGFQWAQVNVDSSDLQADGWLRVEGKAITVPMYNPPGATSTVVVASGNFLRTFDLFTLNSRTITSAHLPKKPGGLPMADAGKTIPTAEREPIRRYALTFEVRNAVTAGSPIYTDSLSAIIFDNSAPLARLDLEELRLNACNPLGGVSTIHLLYTVDHPHLRNFSVSISNNGGTVHAAPPLPHGEFTSGAYFFRGGAGGPHDPVTFAGGVPVDISADPPCAYSVNLSFITRRYGDLGTTLSRLYCH